jgi:phosphonate degradation associated HDIG domain protein
MMARMRTLNDTPVDAIDCFMRKGGLSYEGEGITQLQHAWQCAQLAQRAGASPELRLAAWLHDLGHLLTALPGSPTLQGIDDRHEVLGAAALATRFGPSVCQPVALHVQAKRCLVARQPGYLQGLSADSLRSLALQGGPMSAAECTAFLALPHARDAMRLRVWDDQAKDPDWCFDSPASALQALASLMRELDAPAH